VVELGDAAGEPAGVAEGYQGGAQDAAADGRGDMTVDFGFYAPVAVCTELYVDRNNNGVRDPGDPAIPGITLTAYTLGGNGTAENGGGDDQVAGSDVSNGGTGAVGINDLVPGVQYYIEVDMSGSPLAPYLSFPLGSDWTESPVGSGLYYSSPQAVSSTGNSNECSANFSFDSPGFFEPVAVGDYTWVDIDGDGQQAGDPPLEGVLVTLYDAATGMEVTLDADNNPVASLETDANGEYGFENLPPGSYYVVFDKDGGSVVEPAFYELTAPNQGPDVTDSDAALGTGRSGDTPFLSSGEEDLTLDAGYICAVTADAGTGQTICSTATVDLTALGASIGPAGVAGFGATWTSSGGGTFDDGAGEFGVALTYTPDAAEIAAGQVMLTLTTDDPAGFGSACLPASDDVLIVILKVDCGMFPWDGN